MTKILENAILIATFILLLVGVGLGILESAHKHREYKRMNEIKCEISFAVSMVTVPCEYVDGVVKIRI